MRRGLILRAPLMPSVAILMSFSSGKVTHNSSNKLTSCVLNALNKDMPTEDNMVEIFKHLWCLILKLFSLYYHDESFSEGS